ncbi:MAG: phosphoribosyl-ATP diphosphatase [Pseudohongiellaceae bacterium]
MSDILQQLAETLEQRKSASGKESYVASLHEQGLSRILEKVAEEATETIQAARNSGNKEAVIQETADLWFHTLVMLSHLELGPDEVLAELEKRFNISGLAEKASRQKSGRLQTNSR